MVRSSVDDGPDIRFTVDHRLKFFHMTIELSKDVRQVAIASIERYFLQNMDEKIGNIAAGALLGFFLEEIGPSIYNKAVTDTQERMQMRVSELDIDVHEDEFAYWRKFDKARKSKS